MKKHSFIWLLVLALVAMLASAAWASTPVVYVSDGLTTITVPDIPDGSDIVNSDGEPDNDGSAGDATGTTGNRAVGELIPIGSDLYCYILENGIWILYSFQVLVLLGMY